ncbi:hypothetical protein GCM10009530_64000 [Microbispora corallina]|uniref:Uncharacterized protein n=1 Tax=Microbispora corallina TaxID=83302 RepID=A0ABQ4GCF3_9ACTN|nr:hypothetical protein [Microbispora corallina]GIH44717.1 hypothetical protein Mco01_77170 [Microbispora corallina]
MIPLTTVLLWAALLAGLVPATLFLASFRPSWPPRSPAFTVSGLVLVVWLLYARVALLIAVRGWVGHFAGWSDATISIGFTAVCDTFLIYLLVVFRKFKATWVAEMDRRSK